MIKYDFGSSKSIWGKVVKIHVKNVIFNSNLVSDDFVDELFNHFYYILLYL